MGGRVWKTPTYCWGNAQCLLALNPRLSEHKAGCPTILGRAWPSSTLFTGWRVQLERSG